MVQTVYVVIAGTYKEGGYVVGVRSTVEKAKELAESHSDGALKWDDLVADVEGSDWSYYEVKGCVVDA